MECLPQTGLSAGTTVAIVAIALALIAVAIVLIVKSRRARTGALMAIGLVGLLGALPLAGAPNAAAGTDCNGANAVYITSTATETAAGPTVSATTTETVTADAATVTHTAAGATVTETAVSTVTETAPGPTTMVTSTALRECTTPPAWLTAYTTQGGWLQGESYVVQADEDTTGAGGGDALARIEEILTRGTVDGQALCDLKITWVQAITQSTEPDNTMGRTLTYTGWNHASNGPLHLAFDAGEWGQQPWF
ncbi:LPXTG cell wall anchor domain-containing protein [Galactobacter valiniphilus]|uniref:LPXTG cell wall anchor domain-containing protein n=1 Tax=Galactobacter valiniphilus TaxID=2676122 RepID=A0A399J7G2_9MICC|nr:LPXTG cell wall anchor domain-containing protein [Galactobacter valiniphilus]RII41070.1 LPXTG cell wall anchor domain-containing protein [Galactobacter valiniphilus]